jgi:hypothetical protein
MITSTTATHVVLRSMLVDGHKYYHGHQYYVYNYYDMYMIKQHGKNVKLKQR